MNIGISTACLYPLETEKALNTLVNCGFNFFEIFYNTISEISPDFTDKISKILSLSGSRVKSVHPFTSGYEPYLIFTDYTRRFKDSLEFYKKYFDCAAKLGAEILVIHGDRKTPETGGISDSEYFEKFGELSIVGESFGITVAQENVNIFRSQNPVFLRNMREYLGDRAKFVLDVKQAVRSGNDPFDVCSAMGGGLVHLHINDNNSQSDCVLPGQGDMDYKKLFSLMNSNGYKGDAVIEVYRKSFNHLDELVKSCEFLKNIILDE